ncbi:hypothetical protein BC937DRAFT_88927 [Endogone sp. FLAS-F59071]|nr:hypothetical protein BC937DRAFT_88927 [Endogone sp. FLAS-F59071]|eukprot:RUS18320.1 hypothetical protein BC937DRAFT_88927 [Endogone sp. FLAS-F59071]
MRHNHPSRHDVETSVKDNTDSNEAPKNVYESIQDVRQSLGDGFGGLRGLSTGAREKPDLPAVGKEGYT